MIDEYAEVRVYCYFYENELYAWTTDKKIKKQFERERGVGKFQYKKIILCDDYYRIFINKNHQTMMIEIPLYDGESWLSIMSTSYESTVLDESQSLIYDEMNAILNWYLQEEHSKYYKSRVIDTITNATLITRLSELNDRDQADEIIEINTFALFYYLFNNTFTFKEV